MTVSFTYPQLQIIRQNLGFEKIESYHVQEDDLRIYGSKPGEFAEASLFIDFCTKSIYVTVFYFGNDFLDEEKKFRLDF